MRNSNLSDRVIGRWRGLLPSLGLSASYLSGKHGPCPFCAGKDRWRFADAKGMGTWYCSQCGDSARSGYGGTGWDLVMRLNKCTFFEAKKLVEPYIETAPIILPKAADYTITQTRYMGLWKSGDPLDGEDLASRYLANRGISFIEYPKQLRFLGTTPYTHSDKKISYHPAMLALFVGPDRESRTLHVTYLDQDGRKADLEPARKLAPGPVPKGGAVRLAASAETMGVAEGIETALSAMILDGVPVWSALSAGALLNWQPPPGARNVIVYGDTDASFTGQSAAYSLAHKLRTEGYAVDVRLPPLEVGGAKGADWNDVLRASR